MLGDTGNGYPDITLLPRIANYFEVTIDTLMGNDEIGVREDIKRYWAQQNAADADSDKKLQLALEYYRKYPKDYHVMSSLARIIVHYHHDKIEEYMPLLREICRKLLNNCTDSTLRRSAVRYMCLVCDDKEVHDWMQAYSEYWNKDIGGILEERHRLMNNKDKYLQIHHEQNLISLLNWLYREQNNPYKTAEDEVIRLRQYIRIIENLGNGDVPSGWYALYILNRLKLASALCGSALCEQGLDELEIVLALSEKWSDIPDGEMLDMGNSAFFGELKMKKGDYNHVYFNDGTVDFIGESLVNQPIDLYEKLTQQNGWEWFDSVRENPRFIAIMTDAKEINFTDKTEEKC